TGARGLQGRMRRLRLTQPPDALWPTRVNDARHQSPPAAVNPPRRQMLRLALGILRSRSLRTLFLLAMIGLLVFTLVAQGPKFWADVRRLPLWVVLLAFLSNVWANISCMQVWRAGLRILGSRLSFSQACRVFF